MSGVVTVSELTGYIANLIGGDNALRSVAVRGEISNFKRYSSGHCYFNLKDRGAIIPCVMFRGSAARMRFQPGDGMQVIASGSVNVYTDGGKYQLYVSSMTPDGIGDLAAAFEQLKERLAGEGLFDEAHKKPLPLYPGTIGIVTSPTGAVLRDIFRVSKLRFPGIRLALKPVQVQGAGSAEQIAAAIDFFNERYTVDVLIVGRGGAYGAFPSISVQNINSTGNSMRVMVHGARQPATMQPQMLPNLYPRLMRLNSCGMK